MWQSYILDTLKRRVTGDTMSATAERAMARPKGKQGKRSDRDDIAVKLDRALVSKARLIAAHRGLVGGVAELLSELASGPVDKAYAQMLRELESE
jgi:hypothetical protein